ncbi:hypothetical protein [Nocardiopsis sp. YSL2]|uniref:hypothetical protein n=1 Tax=Nocardiopsis sp. YSL2 TaxID=2939492 RepID=UPI0026F40C9B|nr:hypothetical protein [Nocardiopsis sp. YSL2]
MVYGLHKGDMGPAEEEEAIRDIAADLSTALPEGWTSATYTADVIGGYMNELMQTALADGETVTARMPRDTGMKTLRLRSGMYKPGKGTWFTMELSLWSNGKYRCNFNYESEPEFDFDPDEHEYTRELKTFPRNEDFMPEWLQAKATDN